jgi:TonB family protein
LTDLQKALEDIRRQAALDKIQKQIASRPKTEEKTPVVTPTPPAPVSPQKSPQRVLPQQVSVPGASSKSDPGLLDAYYSLLWARIKEAWTLPENFVSETVDLETIIIVLIDRDGKVRKMWIDKKSGDVHYDQAAMRAIKKAEPLPPIPKELGESNLEVGFRFLPD